MNGRPTTRSIDDGIAPIAYIVDFEGDGYAVLRADLRAPGVMTITDEGELGPEHFAYYVFSNSEIAGTRSDNEDSEEDIVSYVNKEEFPYLLGSFINAYIQEQIADAEENPETRATWTWNGKTWTILEHVDIQCRSLWHQGSPFNDNCSAMMGKTVDAGCVAIALAQIMTYHQYPKTWSGTTLPWGRIRSVYTRYNSSTTTTGSGYDQEWASYLVAVCGTQADTKYSGNGSSASDRKARIAMENMGYRGVDVRRWSGMSDISTYVAECIRRGCPAYYSGERSTGFLS